jgi:hypothetical protein
MPVPFDLTSTRARPRCIAGSTLSGWMGWIGGKGREGKGSDWWRSATGGRRGGSHPRRSATSSVGNLFLSGHRRFIETTRDGVLS